MVCIMNRTFIKPSRLIRVWNIEDYPNYFFGTDDQLYRLHSQGRVRRNKQVMIGYTQGYVLKSKFFRLVKLRPLLRQHEPALSPR